MGSYEQWQGLNDEEKQPYLDAAEKELVEKGEPLTTPCKVCLDGLVTNGRTMQIETCPNCHGKSYSDRVQFLAEIMFATRRPA